MKKINKRKYPRILFYFLTLIFGLRLGAADNFKLVETHDYGDKPLRFIWYSTVTTEGNLVVGFFKSPGIFLITPEEPIEFGFFGQGGDDLDSPCAVFPYQNDIGLLEEQLNRIKIFSKTSKGVVCKESKWLKRPEYHQFVKDIRYVDNKFFAAGEAVVFQDDDITKCQELRVFDNKGQPIIDLIPYQYKGLNEHSAMRRYLVEYQDKLFLFLENKLALTIISYKDLTVKGQVNLTTPSFYKPAGADFFSFKRYPKGSNGFIADLEYWITHYSRITKVVVDGKFLVVQIRTCQEGLKKFCLLFYDADTFKLHNQVFIDDYLLGYNKGKYYFFQNGDPSLDENTDKFVIKVYQWVKQK